MADFEATVRLYEVEEHDAPAAKQAIDGRLRAAGFRRWRIVSVGKQGEVTPRARQARRALGTQQNLAGGGLLVAAMGTWALWFLWLLAG